MDLLIVTSAALIIGVALGYAWGNAPERARQSEQAHQERIEQEVRATYLPRHRATAENVGEPAVIRAARIVGSKAWRK